jgi:hypothetical protein
MIGIQILTEVKPKLQLACQFFAEASFIAYLITNFRRNAKVYQSKFDTFLTIWASFLRMNLIISFYWFEISYDVFTDKIEYVQEAQIISYLILWIVSTFCISIDQ